MAQKESPFGPGTEKNPVEATGGWTQNLSVSAGLADSNVFWATAASDDGEVYGIVDEGGSGVLKSTTSPKDSWTTRYTFPAAFGDELVGLHITSAGTILVGNNSTIYRSTDGGDSFSDTGQAISDSVGNLWSIDEDSSGGIYAIERGGDDLLKSTDDGQTWGSVLNRTADTTFDTHLHKVAVHPANDWIYVTGGDSASDPTNDSVFRSKDGGSTWTGLALPYQLTGVTPHPTDGSMMIFGTDGSSAGGAGILRTVDDGSSITDFKFVHSTEYGTVLDDVNFVPGCHAVMTVTTTSGSYYLGPTLNLDTTHILASADPAGESWRSVATTGESRAAMDLSSQGPHASVISANDVPQFAVADLSVDLDSAREAVYGFPSTKGVDERPSNGDINLLSGDSVRKILFESSQRETFLDAVSPSGSGWTDLRIDFQNGTIYIRDKDTPEDIWKIEADAGSLGRISCEVPAFHREPIQFSTIDVTTKTPDGSYLDQMAFHDGSGALPYGLAQWESDNFQWRSLIDGSTVAP